MKLWRLGPRDDLQEGANPWEPWSDRVLGFAVRAETEERARQIADEQAGNENGYFSKRTGCVWADAAYSTCTELVEDGVEGVIAREYAGT